MYVVLRSHELRQIRKMMDEVFSKRNYAYSGYRSVYFEKEHSMVGFPNMYSTSYVYVVDFEDILRDVR
jgi:hypothetical protein